MDTNKDDSELILCVCCLSRQSPLVNLATCTHASFLTILFENQVKPNMCVCNMCHSFIKKVDSFKCQVEESLAELNGIGIKMAERSNNWVTTEMEINSFVEDYLCKAQVIEPEDEQIVKSEDSYSEIAESSQLSPLVYYISNDIDSSPETEILPDIETKPLASVQMPVVKVTASLSKDILKTEDAFKTNSLVASNDCDAIEDNNDSATLLIVKPISKTHKVSEQKKVNVTNSNGQSLNQCKIMKLGTDVKVPQNRAPKRKTNDCSLIGEKIVTNKRIMIVNVGPKYRKTISKKYVGKIKIIMLSHEEIMQERLVEATKTSYLNLPFKCESCIVGFDHELTLLEHNKQKHTEVEGSFVCTICKSVLCSERSYKEHRKRHMRRYVCEECGKRNNNIYPVIKHYNEQHGTIKTHFECQDCGFVTDLHSRYKYHRETHKQRVKCELCTASFVNPPRLRVHMMSSHGLSDREYQCHICGKNFKSKPSLKGHVARHDAKPSETMYCAPCKTYFRNVMTLKNHLKTHSRHVNESDLRFQCNECGQKYTSQRALDEHVDWTHLKKVKHECTTCAKPFRTKSALVRHVTFVHEKKRPPRNKICDLCGRGFTSLTILRGHVRTHTGEKPFTCPQCPSAFAHSAALYTHKKLMHSGNRVKAEVKKKKSQSKSST